MAGSRVAMSSLKVTMMLPPLAAVSAWAETAGASAVVASIAANAACRRKVFFINELLCWFFARLLRADARIDEGSDDVGKQVAKHDRQRRNQCHAHDDRYVDLLDRLPGELADARPTVHRLDHDHATHELADIDADHCDDRQNGVGQRVPEKNAHRRQALGTRGT